MKTSDEIREAFLKYFSDRGHQRVQSSSLVPKNDPTLLFSNAGMNQFKDVFLGQDKRHYRRATSSQKCMRVSGKHNDLETVGRTPRHHTFFEMLGNFSFGDYFKTEAIEFAWELCTEVYGLDQSRLVVTVFEEDDEALEIWRDHIGFPSERIFKCGASENFWSMGETGPCGPCSELHYDMGDRVGDTFSQFGEETDRFVEIWNLVFMQFNRDAQGKMTPLPSPSIDTGMGLERIACVLQGVSSNYETDLFMPLIHEASRLTGVVYGEDPVQDVSLRILADHSRAAMFLVNDGIVPGNEGRGYVLRKIVRRAIRHGSMLGKKEPFLYTLTALVAELMATAYPELSKSREYAAKVVQNEEEKFSTTLSQGLNLLEDVFDRCQDSGKSEVPGTELFKLYDTFGFPFDLACEIAAERGLTVDEAGFRGELERQRERARASWKGGEAVIAPVYQALASEGFSSGFTGYDEIQEVSGKVLAILRAGERVDQLKEGEEGEIILDITPFYAAAGGQVGDQGIIENETFKGEVTDVHAPASGVRLHKIRSLHGSLQVGDTVRSSVDRTLRQRTANNHTATHLLQAALKEVLGEHVKQAGSLVAPERLRFDFTHYKGLSAWEIRQIEERVNEKIRQNLSLNTETVGLNEAIESGATALFGEKYGENVRVVSISEFSKELCGGTHVSHTGELALFKIISESSISAGVRRIEAITADDALLRFLKTDQTLATLAGTLKVSRDRLDHAVDRILVELKEANKEIDRLKLMLAQKSSASASEEARQVSGVNVVAREVPNVARGALRELAEQIKHKMGSGVVVLGTSAEGKVSLVVTVSDDLTDRLNAGKLIRPIADEVGGGGGGRADMAEAGGKKPEALAQALEKAYSLVETALG